MILMAVAYIILIHPKHFLPLEKALKNVLSYKFFMHCREICHNLSKMTVKPFRKGSKAVEIPFIIQIRLGIGFAGPCPLVVFYRFLPVSQSVVAYAQLQQRDIIITVRPDEPVGMLSPGTGELPNSRLLV